MQRTARHATVIVKELKSAITSLESVNAGLVLKGNDATDAWQTTGDLMSTVGQDVLRVIAAKVASPHSVIRRQVSVFASLESGGRSARLV